MKYLPFLFVFIFIFFSFLVGCREVPLVYYASDSKGFSLQYPAEFWEVIQDDDSIMVLQRSSDDDIDVETIISSFKFE